MQQNIFKYVLIGMLGISLFSIFSSLMGPDKSATNNYNVQVTQTISAEKGLNLQAVGELLKKAKNGEEFEKLLNDSSNSVNNLDLNQDGKVDYINVTEFGDGSVKGFSLTTETSPGEVQEIATIKIEKAEDGKTAEVETKGNPQIYGQNHYYHSSWSGIGTGLLMGYLFSSFHRPWSSPYSYGNYPSAYRSSPPMSPDAYQRHHNGKIPEGSYTKSTRGRYDSIKSPNSGRTSSTIKAPLKNPTRSQKTFQVRSQSKPSRKGGFGKSPTRRKSGVTSRRSGGFGRRR